VVDHTQYEHASIPGTLKKVFGLSGFLTKRDAAANTFEGALSLATPRMDTSAMVGRVPHAATAAAHAAKLPFLLTATQLAESVAAGVVSRAPLSEFQKSLTDLASTIARSETVDLAAARDFPQNEHDAAEHVRSFASRYFGIATGQ
jgi:phospholipase C